MLAFAGMLVEPAKQAGMKVPEDPEDFEVKDFFHFHLFLVFQLGAPLPYPSAHWDNAKTIASLSEDDLQKMTVGQLMDQLALGLPIP